MKGDPSEDLNAEIAIPGYSRSGEQRSCKCVWKNLLLDGVERRNSGKIHGRRNSPRVNAVGFPHPNFEVGVCLCVFSTSSRCTGSRCLTGIPSHRQCHRNFSRSSRPRRDPRKPPFRGRRILWHTWCPPWRQHRHCHRGPGRSPGWGPVVPRWGRCTRHYQERRNHFGSGLWPQIRSRPHTGSSVVGGRKWCWVARGSGSRRWWHREGSFGPAPASPPRIRNNNFWHTGPCFGLG